VLAPRRDAVTEMAREMLAPTLLAFAAVTVLWAGRASLEDFSSRTTGPSFRSLLALHETAPVARSRRERPNIVWILTDDQDQVLGGSFPPTSPHGATPMPKTQRLLSEAGIHAENWHIHVPICSPSRSTLLSGRYFHNIKQVGGSGVGMHVNYSKVNDDTFVRRLHDAGYMTGMFGKYLNVMPEKVPPGFDVWFANGGGDYIAPRFMTKGVDGLPEGWVKFSNAPSNYSTSVIGNISLAFIEKAIHSERPFMAYIAPKAAHEPFNPAPWYRDTWDASWPEREPRAENWNCSAGSRRDHHGNIATEPLLSPEAARVITGVFKNRWRTLLSVDDLIADVIGKVEELGQLDNTYFFFSSDHGFQLGQFNIPMDKRHVYEWDTKIHLVARGPGIRPSSSFSAPGTQVDVAPTLLGLAGLAAPVDYDGHSIARFLISPELEDQVPQSTQRHLRALAEPGEAAQRWRKELFIEYYFVDYNTKCVLNCPNMSAYPFADSWCGDLANNRDCWCSREEKLETGCYYTETPANNFIALRDFSGGRNVLYAEFQTGQLQEVPIDFSNVDFLELYDVAKDPWQMSNLINHTEEAAKQAWHRRLREWYQCAGNACP